MYDRRVLDVLPRPLTKDSSILILPAEDVRGRRGRSSRCRSRLWRSVPPGPSSGRAWSCWLPAPLTYTVSVTSSVRLLPSNPAPRVPSRRSLLGPSGRAARQRGSRTSSAEGYGHSFSCHSLALHASLKICSPIGITRPLCSATGTNSEGSRSPRSGWSHLTRASMPHSSPVSQIDHGLVVDDELLLLHGPP